MSGSTVEIKDIPAFPAKVAAIRDAVTQLRAATMALSQITDTATTEASSFTKGGVPAPVYGPLLAALQGWMAAIKPAADVVSDNADNAARTAASKFYAIVQTDQEAASAIAALQSSGALGGGTSTGGTGGMKSFADLQKEIGAKAGVAYIPLFGDNPTATKFGDLQSGDAWSTIKAPIALAAMRENGGEFTPDMAAAITRSDNAAADRLWESLGDPQTAAQKVQDVLRGSGDMTTQVNSATPAPVDGIQPSAYGQTQWALENQLQFMSHLSQDPNGAQILGAMSQVSPDQQWGLGQLGEGSQFKGGWGPSGPDGENMTRQMGIVDGPGGQYAVATMVAPDSGGLDAAQTDMTQVSKWLPLS